MACSLLGLIMHPFLKIGVTVAFFQSVGITPCLREAENRMNKHRVKSSANSLRNLAGMLLGSAALDQDLCYSRGLQVDFRNTCKGRVINAWQFLIISVWFKNSTEVIVQDLCFILTCGIGLPILL